MLTFYLPSTVEVLAIPIGCGIIYHPINNGEILQSNLIRVMIPLLLLVIWLVSVV
jgi:hypothetical protein